MALTRELVEQLQKLHLASYGEQISYGEAEQELQGLAELVRITSPTEESDD